MLNKIKNILKIILGILIIGLFGWLAITFKINIGGILRKLFNVGMPKHKATVKSDGKEVGKVVTIYTDSDPFRDRTVLKTIDGDEIKLPKGVKDNHVSKLIKMKTGYKVVLKHKKLTDVLE